MGGYGGGNGGSGDGYGMQDRCCEKKFVNSDENPEMNGYYVLLKRAEWYDVPDFCNSPCVYIRKEDMDSMGMGGNGTGMGGYGSGMGGYGSGQRIWIAWEWAAMELVWEDMDPAWEDMDQDTDLDLDQAPALAWVDLDMDLDLEAWEDLAMDPTLAWEARMTTTMMPTR